MRIKPRKPSSKNIQLLIQSRCGNDDDDYTETESDESVSSQVNIHLNLRGINRATALDVVSSKIKHNADSEPSSETETDGENSLTDEDKIKECELKRNVVLSYLSKPKPIGKKIQPPNTQVELIKICNTQRNMPSICLTNCRYASVSRVAKSLGWRVVRELHLWNVSWTDSVQGVETYKEMRRFQKINHFPGMTEICRKDLLARNLNRMLRLFPKDYNIFPKTWCFPADLGEAIAYSKEHKYKTYILKPDQGAQGRGIWLTKNLKDIKPNERMICQVYITKPLLIDGYKFDLRVYTLVTSVDPLRVFVYNEGLARFATSKYKEPTGHNTTNVYMHLTNYSVNKHSRTFCKDDQQGSKRKFSTLNKVLREEGYDVQRLWNSIDDCINKTILSTLPVLKHHYHACFPCHDITQACFEILGFDVLVDHKLKPYVLEVNHSPSFHCDEAIDREVKESLIRDTFNLLNISVHDKRKVLAEDKKRVKKRLLQRIKEHRKYYSGIEHTPEETDSTKKGADALQRQINWEESHLGGFRRIMPAPDDPHKYIPFFILQNQASIFSDTAASKRRGEAAKELRSQIIERDKRNQEIAMKTIKKTPTIDQRPSSTLSRKRRKEKVQANQKWSIGNLICEAEERERAILLSQRDFLVRNSGIFQQIYESFHRHKILSDSDRRKYKELFDKLESKRLTVNFGLSSSQGSVTSSEAVPIVKNPNRHYSKIMLQYPKAWQSIDSKKKDNNASILANAKGDETRAPYYNTKKLEHKTYFDLFRVLRSELN